MSIEYVVFGALVIVALAATLVGIRRRRADMHSGDAAATFPYIDRGSAGTGDGIDGGGGSHGGGFEGGGGSHGGGGFDGGGGHAD